MTDALINRFTPDVGTDSEMDGLPTTPGVDFRSTLAVPLPWKQTDDGVDNEVQMNNVYFACTDCKTYTDAGYRWAYWQLEKPGTVLRSAVVEVDRLLSADGYWKPESNERNAHLTSVLSHAVQFISVHKTHCIVYGDMEQLIGAETDEYGQFAWMDEYPVHETDLGPRNFVEQRGMRTWGEVTAYIASRPEKPWWYRLRSARVIARRKFDELILSARDSGRAQKL